MEQDEWKRSQNGSGKQDPEEHDRQMDTDAREAGGEGSGKETVPYMERLFGTEEEEDEDEDEEDPQPLELLPSLTNEAAAAIEVNTRSLPDLVEEEADQVMQEDDSGLEAGMDTEELNKVIEDLCRSKAEEFRMLGYEQVTGREIWECVSDKYRKTGIPPLHRIVNDILSLKVTQFMNWMTMSIYKDAHFR